MSGLGHAVARRVSSVGLYGDGPDGPVECSFGGYARLGQPAVTVSGDQAIVHVVGAFKVLNPTGIRPVGFCLFDDDDEILVTGKAAGQVPWMAGITIDFSARVVLGSTVKED